MQIIPGGVKKRSFIDRCTKELNRCTLEELGDQVSICGKTVCAIFDHVVEKVDLFGDGKGQVAETITLEWLKTDQANVRSGDRVTFNGANYKIKRGYPIDLRDCWLMAELTTCENK